MLKLLIIFIILNYLNPVKGIVEFNLTNAIPKSNEIISENRKYYRINWYDHFEFDVTKHFLFGFIFHSFESTFRIPIESLSLPYLDDWYLFNVKSNFGNRFYIALSMKRKELIFYGDSYKHVTKVVFPNIEIFDGKWHSIMYTLTSLNLKVYVDCELRANKNNETKSKLEYSVNIENKMFSKRSISTYEDEYDDEIYVDSSPEIQVPLPNWKMEIAQGVNLKHTFPIDISKMRFHGYPNMPTYAGCEDVDKSYRRTLTDTTEKSKHHKAFNQKSELMSSGINKTFNNFLILIISSVIFLL